jgi:hypothetical protein
LYCTDVPGWEIEFESAFEADLYAFNVIASNPHAVIMMDLLRQYSTLPGNKCTRKDPQKCAQINICPLQRTCGRPHPDRSSPPHPIPGNDHFRAGGWEAKTRGYVQRQYRARLIVWKCLDDNQLNCAVTLSKVGK